MMNSNTFLIILAVAAVHTEALVSPRRLRWEPTQRHRTSPQPPALRFSDSSRNSSPVFIGDRCHQRHDFIRYRTSLQSVATSLNGDDGIDNEEVVNEFQPRTMKVSQSFAFFARYVVQTILDKRAERSLGKENRRRLRDRVKRVLFLRRAKSELGPAAAAEKKAEASSGVRASIRKLNESRKNLIRLVGYDSSLLFPAFAYLIMGAFMSSVIPHYYSSCISYVAAGEASREKLLWALGGLGLSHVLEAIFTGFRGALFWIAGELSFPAGCLLRTARYLTFYPSCSH